MAEERDQTGAGTSRRNDPGFWRDLLQQGRLAWRLLRDPEVPIYLKVLPVAAAFYVLLPFDFMPDLWPVLGQLDDITAVFVGMKIFIELTPPHVVARHLAAMDGGDGDVIEGQIVEE